MAVVKADMELVVFIVAVFGWVVTTFVALGLELRVHDLGFEIDKLKADLAEADKQLAFERSRHPQQKIGC